MRDHGLPGGWQHKQYIRKRDETIPQNGGDFTHSLHRVLEVMGRYSNLETVLAGLRALEG